MTRKITAVVPWLDADLRQRIIGTAEETGFAVSFFENEEDALADARDAEILFGVTPRCLREARALRWLCVPFAGIDSVRGLVPEGVLLTNGAGAYGTAISEHVLMVVLMLLRREDAVLRRMDAGVWLRGTPIRSLAGKRVLILGTGDIGQACAARFAAFQVRGIAGVNRTGHRAAGFDRVCALADADALFPEADVTVCCLPGTDETENALSEARIFSLPPGAIIVNVGRGRTLDEEALVRALREGRVAGAALDVMRHEPPAPDDPLWTAPNLILTPHCAGDMTVRLTRERCAEMFITDLRNYAAGRPLRYTADAKKGY